MISLEKLQKNGIVISRATNTIIQVAAVVGAITVIAGGYSFYLNNIWKPKVEIVSVDFNKGEAEVKVKDKKIQVYGDASFLIGADWGVRFGGTYIDGKYQYNRIELTKKNMVVDYLKEN